MSDVAPFLPAALPWHDPALQPARVRTGMTSFAKLTWGCSAEFTTVTSARGTAYECRAGNHRHYYDARRVARAVNEALEDAKAELRFSAWNECHILTTPGALETFAARFQLESLIK